MFYLEIDMNKIIVMVNIKYENLKLKYILILIFLDKLMFC